jgi:hypothetical protein
MGQTSQKLPDNNLTPFIRSASASIREYRHVLAAGKRLQVNHMEISR